MGRIVTGRQDVKQIDAKPVRYRGVDFRSTLEADWAATLDHYHIEWRYEPALLTLKSGERYLPDFWLPALGSLIEVKGTGVPRAHKPAQFAEEVIAENGIVLIGLEPHRRSLVPYLWDRYMLWRDALGYDARFTRCPQCSAWQWLRPQLSAACRRCKATCTGLLARPGEMSFCTAHPDGIVRSTRELAAQ